MIPKFIYVSVVTRSCDEKSIFWVYEISRKCHPRELSMIIRVEARLRSMRKVI